MGFDFGIKAIFGADTSSLKASLQDAQSQVKGFKKEAEGMGLDLGKLAISAIFTKAAMAIGGLIAKAQELRDEAEKTGRSVDTSVAAMASIADAAKSAFSSAVSFIDGFVGSLALAGRLAGEQWNKYVRGMSESTQTQIELAERAQIDSMARIEKARQTMQERTQAAWAKVTEAQKKSEYEELSQLEKVSAIESDIVKKTQELQNIKAGTIGYYEKELEIEGLKAKFRAENKILLADEKKARADIAKFVADGAKMEEQWRKETSLSLKDFITLRSLELKQAHEISEDEQKTLETLRLQKKQKELAYEINSILSKGVENLSEEENIILNRLVSQNSELEIQIALVENLNKKKQGSTTNKPLSTTITRVGTDYGEQTTENLEYAVSKLERQIEDITNRQDTGESVARFYTDNPQVIALQRELDAVRKEIGIRNSIERNVKLYGVEKAKKMSSLSPMEFDRMLTYATGGDDATAQKTLTTLEKMLDALRGKFRNG
jgi:uncharacterized protein YheU (UPF0270 family)